MESSERVLIDAATAAALIALGDLQAQTGLLAGKGAYTAEGAGELLQHAARQMEEDPGQARALALLAEHVAEANHALDVYASALYLRAQSHAFNAEFLQALALIDKARDSFEQQGNGYEAARTSVGRMFVLQHMGRYADALASGAAVRAYLQSASLAPDARDTLTARVAQNEGLCHEQMGRFELALHAFAEAEAHYERQAMLENVCEVRNNRGIVLLNLGQGRAAFEAFEKVVPVFAGAGMALHEAQAQGNMGNACLLMGQYSKALHLFERVRAVLAPMAADAHKHVLLLDIAEAYLSLNLFAEAASAYAEVEPLLRAGAQNHDHARALWGLGSALLELGHLEEAASALTSANALFLQANNTPMRATTLLKQSLLQSRRGNDSGALACAREALAMLDGDQWPLQYAHAHARIAELLLPDTHLAEPHLQQFGALAAQMDLADMRVMYHQRMGRLRMLQHDDEAAEPHLLRAVDDIEQLRANVSLDRANVSFATDKLAAFDDLISLQLGRESSGDGSHSFMLAERARSQALNALLAHQPQAARNHADSPGAQRIHALRAQLNLTYNALLRANQGTAPDELRAMQTRALELERELSRLQMQLQADQTVETSTEATVTLRDIQDALAPGMALVSYYICEERLIAFVVRRESVRLLGAGAGVPGMAGMAHVLPKIQQLTNQWDRFRAGPEFVQRHLPQLQRTTNHALKALHEILFAPLQPYLDGITQLVIVPHGPLHQVPFHALFNGTAYLCENLVISYAPSATSFVLCHKRDARSEGRMLVMGVADERIPQAHVEARSIAEMSDEATLLLDDAVSVEILQSHASSSRGLHMACHGMFRPGNPMFSSLKLHTGWLTALDAMQLDLRGAQVTLSACESGRSVAMRGDEIMGLARAFLGAGAASLNVSLWLVNDHSTTELMTQWYGALREGLRPAKALQQAQRKLMHGYPHPYYWAPFVIQGKP